MMPAILAIVFTAALPPVPDAPAPLPAGGAVEGGAMNGGVMQVLDAHGGLLVAAPHGGFDRHTDEMARRVALLAGGGYLLASGYRTPARPINVNRPTEGVGLAADQERVTPAAERVWAAWAARLEAQRPRLYVEIHGNSRAASAGAIEVATVGVTPAQAAWLKAEFGRRLAFLAPAMPRLPWLVEPLDPIHYRAGGAKRSGALARVPMALHLETPWAVRADERVRGRYADLIASTLVAFRARLPD